MDGIAVEGRVQEKATSGESYVYDHNMTLSMSSEFIKTRFERAKDRCQNDAALKCKVTSASFQVLGQPDAPLPVAHLSVSLPHESVQAFESSLLEPLASEDAADILVKSRNTSAQNVTNQVRDIEARLSQLKNYRDRMQALASRRNAGTDDLIKIEGEISKTQAEIEQIEGQQRVPACQGSLAGLSQAARRKRSQRDCAGGRHHPVDPRRPDRILRRPLPVASDRPEIVIRRFAECRRRDGSGQTA
jgi:hypothetical protein